MKPQKSRAPLKAPGQVRPFRSPHIRDFTFSEHPTDMIRVHPLAGTEAEASGDGAWAAPQNRPFPAGVCGEDRTCGRHPAPTAQYRRNEMSKSTKMTMADAARIQSSYAKQHGGKVPPNTFPSRMQAVAARNARTGKK